MLVVVLQILFSFLKLSLSLYLSVQTDIGFIWTVERNVTEY